MGDLFERQPAKSAEALLSLLNSPETTTSEHYRGAVIWGLGYVCGQPGVVESLLLLATTNASSQARAEAIDALAGSVLWPTLATSSPVLLRRWEGASHSSDETVRNAALRALGGRLSLIACKGEWFNVCNILRPGEEQLFRAMATCL